MPGNFGANMKSSFPSSRIPVILMVASTVPLRKKGVEPTLIVVPAAKVSGMPPRPVFIMVSARPEMRPWTFRKNTEGGLTGWPGKPKVTSPAIWSGRSLPLTSFRPNSALMVGMTKIATFATA